MTKRKVTAAAEQFCRPPGKAITHSVLWRWLRRRAGHLPGRWAARIKACGAIVCSGSVIARRITAAAAMQPALEQEQMTLDTPMATVLQDLTETQVCWIWFRQRRHSN